MKVHYINILLFALPLNILAHNNNKSYTTPHHTQKKPTTRLLCECELYASANYNSDPEMKEVMDNFNKQTQERFHEYDERMKTTRQKCKDKCDEEIQKIILKDKLEKQMEQHLTTLETKINTDDIPTCICEMSMSDKVEKGCLRCGGVLGGGVAPSVGLFGAVTIGAWINAAMATAIAAAKKAGIEEGVKVVIAKITGNNSLYGMLTNVKWPNFIKPSNYNIASGLYDAVDAAITSSKNAGTSSATIDNVRQTLSSSGKEWFEPIAEAGQKAATAETAKMTPIYTTQEMTKVTSTGAILSDPIIISAIVVVTIAVILLIIYLILRYRRKKKMTKKLQYIKLLEE